MTGNQFLILLTLVPIAGALIGGTIGRFKPSLVIGVGVAAELVLLVVALLWSQILRRGVRLGHSNEMLAISTGGMDGRRVLTWLFCCVFAAVVASVVLAAHWIWNRAG